MAMLLAVVMSVMGASVEVAVDAPCVEPAFSRRLANAGVVLPPDTTLSLRRARAEVLEVTLKPKGAAPMRREVPAAPRDCAGVERVVLALVKAWLASPVMAARAGRDGGAPSVDGGLANAVADGAVPVPAGLDGGSVRVEAPRVDAGADGRVVSSARADVGVATVSGAVDGGLVTTTRGEVGSATTTSARGSSDDGSTSALAGVASRSEVEAGARGPGDGGSNIGALAGVGRRAVIEGGPLGPSLGEIERALGRRTDGGSNATALPGVETRADVDAGPAIDGAAASPTDSDGGVQPSDAPSGVADGGSVAPRWAFGVGLLGGIASGTTTDVVPQGLLSVDVMRGWFGAALDVGVSGAVSRQVPPGRVTSSWQWLSFSARAVWAPLPRVSLDVQLGVRAHRVAAVATGYAETKPEQQLFSVGAVGSVGASVRIAGPVGLTVRATGVVKPPERFTIDNLGAVLDLGSLEGGVHAGVVVRW